MSSAAPEGHQVPQYQTGDCQELSGRLLFLSAVPSHLLFWKVFFGDDPGIKSLCEASDFQKFVIVFPCTFLSLKENCTCAYVGWE